MKQIVVLRFPIFQFLSKVQKQAGDARFGIELWNTRIPKNTFLATISDEAMYTRKAPFFNQNRFFAGPGCKFRTASIQMGVMHQFLYMNAPDRRKDYTQVTFGKVMKHFFQKK
ncbi:hypothetical protein D3C87_00600 [compost metagenome]